MSNGLLILTILTIVLLSAHTLSLPGYTSGLGEVSTTKFGLKSFQIQGATRSDLSYNLTIEYDASEAGNPWQGGIYGYGEIDTLPCKAHTRR